MIFPADEFAAENMPDSILDPALDPPVAHDPTFRYRNDTAVCGICGDPIRWLSRARGWIHAVRASQ